MHVKLQKTKCNTPVYINDLLIKKSDKTTRDCNLNLSCPRYMRCTEGGRAFTVRAIQEWNKLNVDLKRSSSTKHFKGSLNKSILKNQFITQSFTN